VVLDLDLLDAFEVAKECYEFTYAATVLPSWLWAPRDGMRWLLAHGEA
jgi:predicted trehalose synthase